MREVYDCRECGTAHAVVRYRLPGEREPKPRVVCPYYDRKLDPDRVRAETTADWSGIAPMRAS